MSAFDLVHPIMPYSRVKYNDRMRNGSSIEVPVKLPNYSGLSVASYSTDLISNNSNMDFKGVADFEIFKPTVPIFLCVMLCCLIPLSYWFLFVMPFSIRSVRMASKDTDKASMSLASFFFISMSPHYYGLSPPKSGSSGG